MALLGHKILSIFDRYNIVSESGLADGVRKLAAFKAAEPSEPRRMVALNGGAGRSSGRKSSRTDMGRPVKL